MPILRPSSMVNSLAFYFIDFFLNLKKGMHHHSFCMFKFESSYFKFFDNEKSYPIMALMSLICLNIIEGKSYKDPLLFGKCLERQFPQLAKKFFSDTIFIN